LAVIVGAVATPLLLVTAVAVADPLNDTPAPEDGAINVTVTPLTGWLPASFTVACSAVANAVLIVALWGVPAVAVMPAGPPARFVRLKLAEVAYAIALAVTV
jgi:hypothetical protein